MDTEQATPKYKHVWPKPKAKVAKIFSKLTEIPIPSGTKHLYDIMRELPRNCMFEKGRIGGGGTTVALVNDIPTIIAVPYISLTDNKITQVAEIRESREAGNLEGDKPSYPHEVIGIFSRERQNKQPGETTFENTIEDLPSYLENNKTVPKIMVTYNSLPKVLEVIRDSGRYSPEDFFLLVDEYHLLFTEYGYRGEAVRGLLSCYKEFGSFTFMTSTPIDEDVLFEELKYLPTYRAVWADFKPVTVKTIECKGKVDGPKGINATIAASIQNCLALDPTKEGSYNMHIFVNSVKFMNKMINTNKLNPDNCRVIMSKTNTEKLDRGLKIGNTTDTANRINFYTATAFEGCDILDRIGRTFVVSDGNAAHTLIDISTKFLQIAGRIRNSIYGGQIEHVFSSTRYSTKMSWKEFLLKCQNQEDFEKSRVISLNEISNPKEKIDLFNESKKSNRIIYHYLDTNDVMVFDETKKKKDLYNYRLLNDYTKTANILYAYQQNDIYLEGLEVIVPLSTDNLKVAVENLLKHKKNCGENSPSYKTMKCIAFSQYDFLEKALEKMGFDGIKKAKYRTNSIRRTLKTMKMKNSPNKDFNKIARELEASGKFKIGQSISPVNAKEELEKIYSKLNINKKATGTQLKEYYNIEEKFLKVGGDSKRVIIVISPKFIFK